MNKKTKIFKFFILTIAIILIAGIFIYLFLVIKKLGTADGRIEFMNFVSEMGILGYLALFGLQLAQIFLIIIPGEPIEILAGMCYGGFDGLVFIIISASIISALILLAVRKWGRKFVYGFCKKESIEKLENSKLFKNPKKIEFIMLILFIIPGTPKDLLVYIAGLLPIDPIRFILISTIARIPSVMSSTYAGSNLLKGDWKISLIIYAVTFFIVCCIIFIVNKFDKDKTAEEAMKIIK